MHRKKIESKLRQTVLRMQQSALAYTFFSWKENIEFLARMSDIKRKAMNMIGARRSTAVEGGPKVVTALPSCARGGSDQPPTTPRRRPRAPACCGF